jgi:hypothetical protein
MFFHSFATRRSLLAEGSSVFHLLGITTSVLDVMRLSFKHLVCFKTPEIVGDLLKINFPAFWVNVYFSIGISRLLFYTANGFGCWWRFDGSQLITNIVPTFITTDLNYEGSQ